MKSIVGRVLAGLLTSVLLGGMAYSQQFTMKLSSPTINDTTHEWMKAFKAGVEARSVGRIKVDIYPANQLGQIPATVEGVALGTIEFTAPVVGFLTGLEPRFQILDAAGLFDNVAHGQKVLNDPQIRQRLATFGEAKGVEPLITLLNGPLFLLSHRPIRTVADFKGQRLRVAGAAPLYIEPFKKLGASPISMPLGEVLPALQNRAVDGLTSALVVLTAFKYYDVAKGATALPGTFAVVSGIVNRRFMKSLGPELEAIVREEARKHETIFSTFGVEEADRIRQTWVKNGGEIITLPADEAKKYLNEVNSAIIPIIGANPKMKEDYEAFLAVAKKYRQ